MFLSVFECFYMSVCVHVFIYAPTARIVRNTWSVFKWSSTGLNYMSVYVHVFIYAPPARIVCNTWSVFKWSSTGLNSEFSFT